MSLFLITAGPYAGQNLDLPDDIAKHAVKDGWAVDTSAEGYDPFNAPAITTAPPYAPSLQGFLDGLNPNAAPAPAEAEEAPKKAAKSEPEQLPESAPKEDAKAAAGKDYPGKKLFSRS